LLVPVDPSQLSDVELEQLLRERAAEHDAELAMEHRDDRWRASFRWYTDELARSIGGAADRLAAEAPTRREALLALLTGDDLQRS
jgi:hypothetical protein